jgi:hypothetical protein
VYPKKPVHSVPPGYGAPVRYSKPATFSPLRCNGIPDYAMPASQEKKRRSI